ncbi:hypothetical protein [Methylobacterium fujisawaense]
MTDSLTTLSETADSVLRADATAEISALRAHIRRILRKLAAAKSTRRIG